MKNRKSRNLARQVLLFGLVLACLEWVITIGTGSCADLLSTNEINYPFYRPIPSTGDTSDALIQLSLFTGAATYSIPIVVPPGTGGIQPSLALVYNSLEKRGNAGRGWNLELPKIVRATRYGADYTQNTPNSLATYLYDGEELISAHTVEQDPFGCGAIRYYRASHRYERILYCFDDDYWSVTQKNGIVMTFGRLARKIPGATSHHSAISVNGRTVEYYLDEVINSHGISWRAWYVPTVSLIGNRVGINRLDKIQYPYIRTPENEDATPLGTLRSISISVSRRDDNKPERLQYKYGLELIQDFRISEIIVKVGDELVRRYEMYYDADTNDSNGSQLSPDSGASMLRRVRICGTDGVTALPDITFEYKYNVVGDGSSDGFRSTPQPVNRTGFYAQIYTGDFGATNSNLIDFNGDGYPDILKVGRDTSGNCCQWYVHWGHGDGTFEENYVHWPDGGAHVESLRKEFISPDGSAGVRHLVLDMNADGLPDLFTGSHVYLNTGDPAFGFIKVPWQGWLGGSAPSDIIFHRQTDNPFYTDTECDLVDGNGDGCPDWWTLGFDRDGNPFWLFFRNRLCDQNPDPSFASGVEWNWWRSMPAPFLGREVHFAGLTDGLTWTHSDLIDINGDGLIDFYWGDHNKFYMGTGTGFVPEAASTYAQDLHAIFDGFGETPVLTGSHRHLAAGGSVDRGQFIGLLDMNGDGLVDLVRSGRKENCWQVWLNTGSGIRRESIDWTVPALGPVPVWQYIQYSRFQWPEEIDVTVVDNWWRLVDLDGSQTVDLIYLPNDGNHPTGLLELYTNKHNEHEPELLVRLDNGLGAHTTLEYTSSKRQSGATTHEELHFAVPVVKRTDSDDGYGTRYTAEYGYHGPYFDPDQRRFRGFGTVDVYRRDNLGTPSRYEEHLFAVGDRGRRHGVIPGWQMWFWRRAISDPYTGEAWLDTPPLAGRQFAVRIGETKDKITREVWTIWNGFPLEDPLAPDYIERNVRSAHMNIERVYDIDPTSDARKWREALFVYDYYGFGNLLTITDFGEVGGFHIDPDTNNRVIEYNYGEDEYVTGFDYAKNQEKYIVSLPSKILRCKDFLCLSGVLTLTEFYYDDSSMLGIVNTGDLTRVRTGIFYNNLLEDWAVTTYDHDAYGNVISRTDPEGAVTSYTYWWPDFTYMATAQLTVTKTDDSNEQGANITFHRNFYWDPRHGAIKDTTGPNGRYFHYDHDVFGRLIKVRGTPPDYHVTIPPGIPPDEAHTVVLQEYDYELGADPGSNSITQKLHTDNTTHLDTTIYFDGFSRPIQEKIEYDIGAFSTTNRRYNYFGIVSYEVLPYHSDTRNFTPFDFSLDAPLSPLIVFKYDYAGRVTRRFLKAKCASGACRHYDIITRYNPPGGLGPWSQRIEYADPRITAAADYQFDAQGRMITVRELEATLLTSTQKKQYTIKGTTTYQYDLLGNLESYTSPDGVTAGFTYDSRGLERTVAEPNISNCGMPTECPYRYSYDRTGRLVKVTDPLGNTIRLYRDELGRVYYKDYCDNGNADCDEGNQDSTYLYDEDESGQLRYGLLGRLTRMTRHGPGTSLSKFDYDKWGRIYEATRTVQNKTYSTGFRYDYLGRAKKILYPSNNGDRAVRYDYDGIGQLRSVHWETNVPTDPASQAIIQNISYDSLNRTTMIDWGNGLRTEQVFNDSSVSHWTPGLLRLQQYSILNPIQNKYLYKSSYSYYDDGNVSSIMSETEANQPSIMDYTYDYARRITHVERDTSGVDDHVWRFEYTSGGNLTKTWDERDLDSLETYDYIGQSAGPHAVKRLIKGFLPQYAWHGHESNFPKKFSEPVEFPSVAGALGYHFTANRNTEVTALCAGSSHTSQTVKLWNRDTGQLLATATIAPSATWSCTQIVPMPVPLRTGGNYTIAAARFYKSLEGRDKVAYPISTPRVTITSSTFCYNPRPSYINCRPVNEITDRMYGDVDMVTGNPSGKGQDLFEYNGRGELQIRTRYGEGPSHYFYNFDRTLYRIDHPCGAITTIYTDAAHNRSAKKCTEGCQQSSTMTYYFGPHFEVFRDNYGTEGDSSYERIYILVGPQRVAYITQEHPGEIFYVHGDHTDSVVLTTTDDGSRFSSYAYKPFGQEHTRSGGDLRLAYGYTGQEFDNETGLLHLGVRQYNPLLRRWQTPDAVVPEMFVPQSLNRYSYVLNNPIRYTDPSGYGEYTGLTDEQICGKNPYCAVVRTTRVPTRGDFASGMLATTGGTSAEIERYPKVPVIPETRADAPVGKPKAIMRGVEAKLETVFGAYDPFTWLGFGKSYEISGAEGPMYIEDEVVKVILIEKIGNYDSLTWGYFTGYTFGAVEQPVDPSRVDAGPFITEKHELKYPKGPVKPLVTPKGPGFEIKAGVGGFAVKFKYDGSSVRVRAGVGYGFVLTIGKHGPTKTEIKTSPERRDTHGSWDADDIIRD